MEPVRVASVTEAELPSLRALFERAACPCYCRYWHFTGNKNDWLDRCANRPEENADELAASVAQAPHGGLGLVALEGERTVGWMKLELRKNLPKLRNLSVYRSLPLGDDVKTLSIGCFLIDPERRDTGVARALVLAAPPIAWSWGASAIEAYPRRSAEPLHPEEAWQGPERLFVEAGFLPIHDVGPYPVYRLER